MLYDPGKGGTIPKKHFERLLVDASIVANNEGLKTIKDIRAWLQDLDSLISMQLTNIFAQFATAKEKLSFADFLQYVSLGHQPPENLIPYILKVLEL